MKTLEGFSFGDTNAVRVEITISGPPGSGKTQLYRAIQQLLLDEDNEHAIAFNETNKGYRVAFYSEQMR